MLKSEFKTDNILISNNILWLRQKNHKPTYLYRNSSDEEIDEVCFTFWETELATIEIESAFIYSKRMEVRDVIRQALKKQGISTNKIQNIMDEKELITAIDTHEFSFLILDWEMGPSSIQAILEKNRKDSIAESHPVFMFAAKDDEKIFQVAAEYFVSNCTIGEINSDTIREQIKSLVGEYTRLNPIRKVILDVEQLRRRGSHEQAHSALLKLLDFAPDNPRAIVELAESFIAQGQWEKAEHLLRPHLELDPPYARIKHLYARCRLKAQDYNGAIASLKGAQLISPYNTERLLEMGEMFLELDRLDEADEAFRGILEIAPESSSAKMGRSKGMLLAGEVNEALGLLRECASMRELSSVFNTAAIIAIKQKKYSVGYNLYKKALQILAKDKKLSAKIVYNMGIGFVKEGDPQKGLQCFIKSNKLDPALANAKHNITILEKLEKNQGNVQAIEDFESIAFEDTIIASEEPLNDSEEKVSAALDKKTSSHSEASDIDLESIFDDIEGF